MAKAGWTLSVTGQVILRIRPTELVALRWEDVKGDKIFINFTVSVLGNKPVLQNTTKTKRRRSPTIVGSTASRYTAIYAERAGAGATLTRRTYASIRITDSVDIIVLNRKLGHSSASFTLPKYGHVFEQYRPCEAPL